MIIWISNKNVLIDNKSTLIQLMACHLTGDKPIPEPMLTKMSNAIWLDHLIDIRKTCHLWGVFLLVQLRAAQPVNSSAWMEAVSMHVVSVMDTKTVVTGVTRRTVEVRMSWWCHHMETFSSWLALWGETTGQWWIPLTKIKWIYVCIQKDVLFITCKSNNPVLQRSYRWVCARKT